MNKQMAIRIAQSTELIPVIYNGKPVYIQEIDELQEKARVFPLDNLHSQFDVEITSLVNAGTKQHI
ncbi:H-type small acid-soluble spore protein [Ornithinibacillus sp. L9]|uniref:Small, acid-soluble spore protein H n=1 Tax=Ornithinibacillus caprae TaxID=2678566 RepID=A0A6N8FG63_9BACI|nr:H-type small acid-soluble spore protein [Ornithinibacillus caprae]